jgi:hypothetical protein
LKAMCSRLDLQNQIHGLKTSSSGLLKKALDHMKE